MIDDDQPSSDETGATRGVIDRAPTRGTASIVVAAATLVGALYFARSFFVPLLIGILASFALRPLVHRLRSSYLPRPVAAALVLVLGLLTGGAAWVAYAVSGQAAVMIEKLPEATRNLR